MPCSQTSSQAERICMHINMHIHTHTCMSRHLATTMLHENMFVDTYLLLHIHARIYIHTYIQWLFAPLDEPTLNNYHLKQPYSPSFPQLLRGDAPQLNQPQVETGPDPPSPRPYQTLSSLCCHFECILEPPSPASQQTIMQLKV